MVYAGYFSSWFVIQSEEEEMPPEAKMRMRNIGRSVHEHTQNY